jgi:hypothetical protein
MVRGRCLRVIGRTPRSVRSINLLREAPPQAKGHGKSLHA